MPICLEKLAISIEKLAICLEKLTICLEKPGKFNKNRNKKSKHNPVNMNLLKILFSSLSLLISSYALRVSPTIQKTAKYSSQSYDDINKSKSKSKLITTFDDNIGLRAYEDKRDLVLTIRGSCNLEDWKVNLNCLLVEHPHISCGNVHRGYLTNLLNIYPHFF